MSLLIQVRHEHLSMVVTTEALPHRVAGKFRFEVKGKELSNPSSPKALILADSQEVQYSLLFFQFEPICLSNLAFEDSQ